MSNWYNGGDWTNVVVNRLYTFMKELLTAYQERVALLVLGGYNPARTGLPLFWRPNGPAVWEVSMADYEGMLVQELFVKRQQWLGSELGWKAFDFIGTLQARIDDLLQHRGGVSFYMTDPDEDPATGLSDMMARTDSSSWSEGPDEDNPYDSRPWVQLRQALESVRNYKVTVSEEDFNILAPEGRWRVGSTSLEANMPSDFVYKLWLHDSKAYLPKEQWHQTTVMANVPATWHSSWEDAVDMDPYVEITPENASDYYFAETYGGRFGCTLQRDVDLSPWTYYLRTGMSWSMFRYVNLIPFRGALIRFQYRYFMKFPAESLVNPNLEITFTDETGEVYVVSPAEPLAIGAWHDAGLTPGSATGIHAVELVGDVPAFADVFSYAPSATLGLSTVFMELGPGLVLLVRLTDGDLVYG